MRRRKYLVTTIWLSESTLSKCFPTNAIITQEIDTLPIIEEKLKDFPIVLHRLSEVKFHVYSRNRDTWDRYKNRLQFLFNI